jgi:hypothetical protein
MSLLTRTRINAAIMITVILCSETIVNLIEGLIL